MSVAAIIHVPLPYAWGQPGGVARGSGLLFLGTTGATRDWVT